MKKTIVFILPLLISGCYAREMILVDPVVSFQEQGVKNILFIGFNSPSGVKVVPKFKSKLEDNIYKEFEKFTAIKINRIPVNDKLADNYRTQDLINLANKYKVDLLVVGDIRNYIESKYIDQPIQGFYSNPTITNNQSSVRTLNKFQINVLGSVNLIKSNGKVIWTQRIEDIELTQFENMPTQFNPETNTEELSAYSNTRDKLADTITNKLVTNLLPYYTYK